MSVLIKDMEMPTECHGCRWFYFQGTSCTEPKYYLDARCEMVESGQDWYGKDARGGWIGESIEHIPGWCGNYSHQHCVEMGTRASQCPLCELPSAQPDTRSLEQIKWERDIAIQQLKDLGYSLGEKIRTDGDTISRQALMKEFSDFVRASNNSDFARTPTWNDAVSLVGSMPSAQPERKTGRWNKLMMYLADLQLTYSPDWGANGCGDEKLYEFITGLIEELEGWEDGGGA